MSLSRWRRVTRLIRARQCMPGLQRWTKTWLVDFASTYEIYWNVDNDRLDIHAMPSRAFDSAAQYEETRQTFRGAQQEQIP